MTGKLSPNKRLAAKTGYYLERVEYYRWEQKKSWGEAVRLAQIDLKKFKE